MRPAAPENRLLAANPTAGERKAGWLDVGSERIRRADPLTVIAIVAFVIGVVIRAGAGFHLPLWIDETFTGAIVDQDSLHAFVHQLRSDVNAPLYYCVMFIWTKLAGLSNDALRWPSLIFSISAVLLAFRGTGRLDKTTCLLWGSLLSLWIPGMAQASEARCYAMLLLIATASNLAFFRLLESPKLNIAVYWASLSALGILTHYFTAPLVAVQGVAFVAIHRSRCRRAWPALLLFIPAGAWITYNAQRLMAFGDPDVVWYNTIGMQNVPVIVGYALNATEFAVIVAVASLFVLARARTRVMSIASGEAAVVAWVSVLALLLLLLIGAFRPIFSLRYCVPFIPGLLLGVALIIRASSRVWPAFPVFAISLFGCLSLLNFNVGSAREAYSFESAAATIENAGAKRLVFLWDHPSSKVQDPAQMRALGGFFFDRATHPIEVVNVANPWREDPQPRLLAAAGPDGDTAILWVYDRALPKTAALTHAPHIEHLDPSWTCRDHAEAPYVALVCLRRPQ